VRTQARPILQEARDGGSRDERVVAMLDRRIRLFEQIAPYKRSGNVQRWRSVFVARQHAAFARELRADLLGWLPEVKRAPAELVEALEVALSFEVWDRLRTDQRLGQERARAALERIVNALVDTL
jgi:chorismate mutase